MKRWYLLQLVQVQGHSPDKILQSLLRDSQSIQLQNPHQMQLLGSKKLKNYFNHQIWNKNIIKMKTIQQTQDMNGWYTRTIEWQKLEFFNVEFQDCWVQKPKSC